MPDRSWRDCPYRQPRRDRDDGTASCLLVQELLHIPDEDLCCVTPAACHSCSGWFRPSPDQLNPVVASLVYGAAGQLLRLGGLSAADHERLVQLHQKALAVVPHEGDSVCPADVADHQAHTDCSDVSQVVPCPLRQSGPSVRNWAVGVTTAFRSEPTLEACLRSLAIAGWSAPRLFVDGKVALPECAASLPCTVRDPRIGAWPSYYLALQELLLREPQADAYLLVQDDVVFFQHPRLRDYLESVLWPGERQGLVSLFCSRAYTQPQAGWHTLREPLVWGGQALIFPRAALLAFISDPQVVHHRRSGERSGRARIDWLIGEWAFRMAVPVSLPTPSLAQHVGHTSTLWPEVRAYGNRRADRFAGDEGREG